jgi:mRNA interferase MazF
VRRGEIRWYTLRLPDKRRPVLSLTRNDVIDRLNEIVAIPATRTIRGLTTEVVLTVDDGMPAACALNFDHVSLAQRSRIGPVLCYLSEARWAECAGCATHRVRFRKIKRLRLQKQARPKSDRSPRDLRPHFEVRRHYVK